MIRALSVGTLLALSLSLAASGVAAPPAKGGKAAAKAPKEPTTVTSLAMLLPGKLTLGGSPQDVVNAHNQVQGIFDSEFNEELVGMQPGTKMQEKMAERETAKVAFGGLKVFDATTHIVYAGVDNEYTKGNKEAALLRTGLRGRPNAQHFFFFIGNRFWKFCEVSNFHPSVGANFEEVAAKISAKVGAGGTAMPANPEAWLPSEHLAWQDSKHRMRLTDRSFENKYVMCVEDKATVSALPSLRTFKVSDPTAEIGADVAQATKNAPSNPSQGAAPAASGKAAKDKLPPAAKGTKR